MYRAQDEAALLRAAYDEAAHCHRALLDLSARVSLMNALALRSGGHANIIPVQTYTPPMAPPGPNAISMLQGQAAYYRSEAQKLAAALAQLEGRVQAENAPPAPLAPPPRAIPILYSLAELTYLPWQVAKISIVPPFAMIGAMLHVALYTLGMQLGGPETAAEILFAFVGVVWAISVIVALPRLRLLAGGEVGTVLRRSQGLTASRMRNWPQLFTSGWHVEMRFYNGTGAVHHVTVQASNGRIAEVKTKSGYEFRGVVLVHPTTGIARATCDFMSAPRPRADGSWDPMLRPRGLLTTLAGLAWTSAVVGYAMYLLAISP